MEENPNHPDPPLPTRAKYHWQGWQRRDSPACAPPLVDVVGESLIDSGAWHIVEAKFPTQNHPQQARWVKPSDVVYEV